MKPLSEQDHYEILELSRSADAREVERAYRLAQATYARDSLAGYSLFAEGDADALRERVEIAYRVLSDQESRRAYDAALAGHGAARESGPSPAAIRPKPPVPIDELDAIDDESGEFDGARLRRSRLRRGMELVEISGVTKINPTYLGFLEEDRFADLPARVYVRGFVTAYAQCVGLDARRVAASYMRHYEAETAGRRRGRPLGGEAG